MEFKSLKNIESSFRQIRLFGIIFLCLCTAIVGYTLWSSYRFAERQREKIYVLDGGKSLMLALFALLSLYTVGKSVYGLLHGGGEHMEIKHIQTFKQKR